MTGLAEPGPRQLSPLALHCNPRAASHSSTLSAIVDQSLLESIGWAGTDILLAMASCPAMWGKCDPTESFGLLLPYRKVDEIPSLVSPWALQRDRSDHRLDDTNCEVRI